MTTQHTPTPWHRNIPPIKKYPTIFSGRNAHVFGFIPSRGMSAEQAEADADFMLRAVNAHDDLVAALASMISLVHSMLPKHQQSDSSLDNIPQVIAARAALAKARGDVP